MSETSIAARKAMKEKARRMADGDPHAKVDSSDWTPPEALMTTAKTGMRPLSKQHPFKRGGAVKGAAANHHAGKKPRKAGGRVAEEVATALANQNVKESNDDRKGYKHIGGMKKGGRTHKAGGGPLAGPISEGIGGQGRMNFNYPQAKGTLQAAGGLKKGGKVKKAGGGALGVLAPLGGLAGMLLSSKLGGGDKADTGNDGPSLALPKKRGGSASHPANCRCGKCMGGGVRKAGGAVSDGEIEGTRSTGGRMARKEGGRAGKGKMNVNIIISPHGNEPQQPQMGAPPPAPIPPPPRPPMPPMPPPGMGAGPPGMPPGMPPMPPGGLPSGGPPGMPPQIPPGLAAMMPRKRGGRAQSSGSGGGLGRLEKITDYGNKATKLDGHY